MLHAQAGDELGGDVLGAVAGEANAEDAAILDMVTSTADDWQRYALHAICALLALSAHAFATVCAGSSTRPA